MSPSKVSAPSAGGSRIVQMVMNYRSSKILLVAVSYDLFTWIDKRVDSVEKISSRLRVNRRALEILLDALVALGFLRKTAGRYRNIPRYRNYLVRGRPGYMGDNLRYQEIIWSAWSDLKDVVKRGRPKKDLDDWIFRDGSFGPEYIRGMANIAKRPAAEVASLFGKNGATALLDVGAGPGTYTCAFLKRHPTLRASIVDLAPTVRLARQMIPREFRNRVDYIVGDYRKVDFGRNKFDYVLMSHITHDEGERANRTLIRKAFHALRPGGQLVIHDFMTNKLRTSPVFSTIFSVHMLVYTAEGKSYSIDDYKTWLTQSGFSRFERHDICRNSLNASTALIAHRPYS